MTLKYMDFSAFAMPVAASMRFSASFRNFLQEYENGKEMTCTKSEETEKSESDSFDQDYVNAENH